MLEGGGLQMKGKLGWKGAGTQEEGEGEGDQPHPKQQEAPVCLCLLVFRFCLVSLNRLESLCFRRLSGCGLTLKRQVCHFKMIKG